MRRVVSLFLPHLAIERLRRLDRAATPLPERGAAPASDRRRSRCLLGAAGRRLAAGCALGADAGGRRGTRSKQQIAPCRRMRSRPCASLADARRRRAIRSGRHAGRSWRDRAVSVPTLSSCAARADRQGRPSRRGRRGLCRPQRRSASPSGMAATHARALVSDLDFRPAEPEADARAARPPRAARGAALDADRGSDAARRAVARPDRLRPSPWRRGALLPAPAARSASVPASPRASRSPDTPGAAHALARFGPAELTIVPRGGQREALAPLPVAALRLTRDGAGRGAPVRLRARSPTCCRSRADRWRAGSAWRRSTRLDQALGGVAEPITPRRRCRDAGGRAPAARADRHGRGDRAGHGGSARRSRRGAAGARARRPLAAARRLARRRHASSVVGVGTSRPTREAVASAAAVQAADRADRSGPGHRAIRLAAPHTEPLGAIDLGAVLAGDAPVRDLARLVDVVAGRIGERAVFRIAPVESDVPERAVARADPVDAPGAGRAGSARSRLFARPEPLSDVIALLPDQPPRRFDWRGTRYTVVAGDGPERIHGEWWRRDARGLGGPRLFPGRGREQAAASGCSGAATASSGDTGDLSW